MKTKNRPEVGIIMGSDSDLPIMSEAAQILEDLGISFEITIVSAHRTPQRLYEFASNAHRRGMKVLIAGAGGAAHLPGMTAALSPLPVIGVPVKSRISIEGIDSLLSIVQMPPGIPVATVAVNAGKNAGILAAQILGASDSRLLKKVEKMKADLSREVHQKITKLERVGFKKYLEERGEGAHA